MKRRLLVEIDVEKDECAKILGSKRSGLTNLRERCPHLIYVTGGCQLCILFRETVKRVGNKQERLPQCKESERIAKWQATELAKWVRDSKKEK